MHKQKFTGIYSRLTVSYMHKHDSTDILYDNHVYYKTLVRGQKRYELTNLPTQFGMGNILAFISDQWRTNCLVSGDSREYTYSLINFHATVVQAKEHSSFGSVLQGRSWVESGVNKYRFGFNGMELEKDIEELYTTDFRELDTRLGGCWWSTDPIVKPWESPYAGFSDNPIYYKDPKGLDPSESPRDDKRESGGKANEKPDQKENTKSDDIKPSKF